MDAFVGVEMRQTRCASQQHIKSAVVSRACIHIVPCYSWRERKPRECTREQSSSTTRCQTKMALSAQTSRSAKCTLKHSEPWKKTVWVWKLPSFRCEATKALLPVNSSSLRRSKRLRTPTLSPHRCRLASLTSIRRRWIWCGGVAWMSLTRGLHSPNCTLRNRFISSSSFFSSMASCNAPMQRTPR